MGQVVDAPLGTTVQMMPRETHLTADPRAAKVRITRDKKAPAFHIENQDDIYKYRQKELISAVNKRISKRHRINQHDLKSIRKVYRIDESKPEFCFKPKFGTHQYSEEFLDWIIDSYEKNNSFFKNAREKYRNL